MAQAGQIYVIAMGDMIKVGRAANAASRLSSHRLEVNRHGKEVTGEWMSQPHVGWRGNESRLIEFCNSLGGEHKGSEYFIGLDFEHVRTYAETLVELDHEPRPTLQDETTEETRYAFGDVYRTLNEDYQVMVIGSPFTLAASPDRVAVVPVIRMDDLDGKPHPLLAETIPGVGIAALTRFTTIPIGWLTDDEPFAQLDPSRHADVARRIRNFIGP